MPTVGRGRRRVVRRITPEQAQRNPPGHNMARDIDALADVLPEGLWRGRRAFVIGGGPSIDLFDWSRLDGECVVGVNRAIEHCDPAVYFSMDDRCYSWFRNGNLGPDAKKRFEGYEGTRIWLNTKGGFPFGPDIYQVCKKVPGGWSHSWADGIGGGGNSGYGALNVATVLGADPIYLVGFDCKGSPQGKQAWGKSKWKPYPKQQNAGTYHRFAKNFAAIAAQIKERARVINLNPQSKVRCFDFGRQEDIERITRPLIISYYTSDTSYEQHAARLRQSVRRFGLEYEIDALPNMGGWKANTYYKAEFIRQKQLKHPKRALLWLDADAEMVRYPTLFDNVDPDVDLMVHYRNWERPKRPTHELLSGTLYLGATERAQWLVEGWIQANKDNAQERWEQTNLCRAVERMLPALSVTELPPAYCCIFDLMREQVPEPVIRHWQASRKARSEVGA